jgi:flagellar FliJ protein
MSDSSPLPTLIELARQRVDDAARALGEAVRNADAARAKLALLAQYRDDYARRFQAGLERGLSTICYSNFRSFLDKLESAARGQEDAVRDAEGYVEARRSAWEAATRKLDSFLTLLDRARIEKKRVEDKREQRITDERAMRSGRTRRCIPIDKRLLNS